MASVVVVGGANVDVVARPHAAPVPATSNPGSVAVTPGGVGRNIAENLARLGTTTHLLAAVGDDAHGRLVVGATRAAGVDVGGVRLVAAATGSYVALLDDTGELVGGVSDMPAALGPEHLDRDLLAAADLVVLDGNLAPATLAAAWDAATGPVALDPVSVPKAARLAPTAAGRRLFLLSAGGAELAALSAGGAPAADLTWERRGPAGSTLTAPDGVHRLAARTAEVVDVTGAGDAMLAAFCHAWLGGAEPGEAATYAHVVAALTVSSPHTVRPDLTDELVRSLL
ncbi:PfkB family carbohydrate kinase [Nocardioides dongxiaopingii]|uniref:PfkB family carbohydrate kinase n=1 Tax=Nocardioides TaxID=1839 RepID=UPI001FE888FE|nr:MULTISPECIES: PfkB family carbohydrate kinase [Nocardioides]